MGRVEDGLNGVMKNNFSVSLRKTIHFQTPWTPGVDVLEPIGNGVVGFGKAAGQGKAVAESSLWISYHMITYV